MRSLPHLFLCIGLLAILTGCLGNGVPDKMPPTQSEMKDSIVREPEWSKVPALRRIPVSSDLFLAKSVRPFMPPEVGSRKISLRFSRGDATLKDLIGILDYQGVPLVLRSSGDTGLSDDDIGDLILPFRRYDGTLGGLAKKIANSLDLAVWWENDSLYISDRDRYVISVPQNQEVINNVIKELEDFGAEDVTPSMYGGRIAYSVRPAVNAELIKPYLNGLIGNLAEITLQLAVVQLNITDASERGIDWSTFQMQFGNPAKALASGTAGVLSDARGVVGSATGVGSITSRGGNYTKGVLSGSVKTKLDSDNAVGVKGAILYLSQFGKTLTKQMVELRTLAGMKVQLQSLRTTPYVKGLSSTTSTASSSNNVTSSVDTATVDTGLSMNFTPYYDSVLGLVSVNVNIQVSTLVALRTLTYGGSSSSSSSGGGAGGSGGSSSSSNGASSISQPETQKSGITDIVRLPAGEVVILGGLKEENKQENRQSPLDMYDSLGSKVTDNTTTLTFFIMRPVVTIFDPKGATVNTTLPGDPSDINDRAFHDDVEARPVTVVEPVTVDPPRKKEDQEDKVQGSVSPYSMSDGPSSKLMEPVSSKPMMLQEGNRLQSAGPENVPSLITQIDDFLTSHPIMTPQPVKVNGAP